MRHSENIQDLAKALAAFQKEVQNPKRTATAEVVKNGRLLYTYRYTPLHEIIEAVRPLLSKHGLTLVQNPFTENGSIGVTTMILHESGQWIEGEPFYMNLDKLEIDTPQKYGALITYMRRYSASPFLGLADEDDDDVAGIESDTQGKRAEGNGRKPEPREAPKPETRERPRPGNGVINEKQRKLLFHLGKLAKADKAELEIMARHVAGVEKLEQVPGGKMDDFVEYLKARKGFLDTVEKNEWPQGDIPVWIKDKFKKERLSELTRKEMAELLKELEKDFSKGF